MAQTRPSFVDRATTQVLDETSDEAGQAPMATITTWKTHEESNLPDGGYGWVVVGSIFLINAHSWGMTGSYAVFLAYYLSHNTFPGATSLDFAMIGGISFSFAFLIAPIVNICVALLGSRPTLFIGVFFQTAAFIGASFATEIWHLYLSQGLSLGIGIGFMFDATAGIIPQWFTNGRAFANGLASGGSGAGGMIYSLAAFAMVPRLGLAWTFRTLAIIQFVVCGICALLLKDRNKQIGSSLAPFDVKLLKRPAFLLLLGWSFFSSLGYVTLLFSLPNWSTTIGLTASEGSIVGAMACLGQAISRPTIGHFADRAGCINMSLVGTLLSGLFCFVFWTFAHNFAQAVAFGLMSGAVTGTFFTLIAPVCARVVGLVELPAGLSVVWVTIVLPSLFAEPIALEMKKSTGRIYLDVEVFSGSMFFAATACMLFLRIWKIREKRLFEEEAGIGAGKEERVDLPTQSSSEHNSTPDSRPAPRWTLHEKLARFKKIERV
ncbi:major facilitator superfamily transporter [Hyaloscypha variabilis]